LHSLAFDAGRNIGGIDLALSQSIRPFLNAPGYDERLVSLLPMVGTLMYFSEHWKKSQFLPQYDVFWNNEHCVQIALNKLFITCFGKETMPDIKASLVLQLVPEGNIAVGAKSSTSSLGLELAALKTRRDIAEFDLKAHTKVYVEFSASVLLSFKGEELGNHDKLPIGAMFTTLEFFVKMSPLLTWSELEATVPYGIIHTCRMDIGLGKLRGADVVTKTSKESSAASSSAVKKPANAEASSEAK
jgi:hypothetical protein